MAVLQIPSLPAELSSSKLLFTQGFFHETLTATLICLKHGLLGLNETISAEKLGTHPSQQSLQLSILAGARSFCWLSLGNEWATRHL